MTEPELLLGHSPDPDDAFMFYALAREKIPTGPWRFRHILEDIQTLNERARRAELHISALSFHAYPYVADRYALLGCGASMGENYGPMVVARHPMKLDELRGRRIAVPGETTTAFLVLNLILGKSAFSHEVVPFDRIVERVAEGRFDAGLIIHEAQLTYQQKGLHCVADLGRWWFEDTGLPLPLGGIVSRRDLGPEAMRQIAGIVRASIEYGLAHRGEAVEYALEYARGMGAELADRFVGMYVNRWTLDLGETGRQAVGVLLERGQEAGLVPACGAIEFVT